MSDDAGPPAGPYTAIGRIEPNAGGGLDLRRDDLGAFPATDPVSGDLVVLRPTADGLLIERRDGREIVAWGDVAGLTLIRAEAGRTTVPAARVRFATGPSLDFADALAPGADDLPASLAPGAGPLLRVERCRMLTAVVASAAGLAPASAREFHRGERGVAVPELVTRPRVLPRWSSPVLLALSVAAIVLAFGTRWSTAISVTAVLVVHELGHAAVMRMVGMKLRGFLFLPLLGAATVPEHSFATRWNEARVTLAGPATGLPTAGAIVLLLVAPTAEWIGRGALGLALLWALGVNLLNLVPVLPLDGGRVLTCLTAGLVRPLRLAATFAPIVLLAALAALFLEGAVLIGALVFLGLSVSLTRLNLRRQSFLAWMERLPQPLDAVRAALRDVTHGFSGKAREDADGGVAPTLLTPRQIGVVLVLYVAEAVALCVAAGVFLETCPWALDPFLGGG